MNNRRNFLIQTGAVGAALSMPAFVRGAGRFDGKTIRIQFWGGADGLALRKHLVDPFVKETGAKVIVEEGGTAPSIAKVRAQKNDPTLDLVFSDELGPLTFEREGLCEPFDLSRMTNAKDLDAGAIIHKGIGIGLYYFTAGVIYNPSKIKEPQSWNELWDPKYKEQIMIQRVVTGPGLLFTLMAAQLNGGSLDNMEPAWSRLEALRPNIRSFIENRGLDSESFKSGEVVMGVDIPYLYKPYIERGYPIAAATNLKEGLYGSTGAASLIKGGKGDREVVYALMDKMISPSVQAAMAEELWWGPTNLKTVVKPEIAPYVTTPAQMKKTIPVDLLQLSEKRAALIDRWTKVMAVK